MMPGNAPLVLLVEDDRDSLDMYKLVLEFGGFRVAEARNGNDAYERVPTLQPHVIVTDLNLPGLDGVELIRRLKSDDRTSAIPVIALTGRSFPQDLDEARDAGSVAVLVKPCEPERLQQEIRQAIDSRAQS